MNYLQGVSGTLGLVAVAALALAEEPERNPRGVLIEQVRNDQPAFMVRIDVDHADRVYHPGDELRVRVRSGENGYLYLLYCDAANRVSCLYPNAFHADNRVAANQDVFLPRPVAAGEEGFRITMGPPFGQELLKAVVFKEQLAPEMLARLMKSVESAAIQPGARGAVVEQVKSLDWAEHHVAIEMKAREAAGQPRTARRVALCVGISAFADPQIRDLAVAHRDAAEIAKSLQQRCGFDQVWGLVNEHATRANIEQAIRRQLPAATRPGDTVLIYWSGHGSRCADDGGDEQDGFDEYLVPYDGKLTNVETIRQSMILDDAFGRWIQDLDGRRVVVILDTCHSGGQGQGKSLPAAETAAAAPKGFDFLDGELSRIKDIGQRETALIASSAASQVSFERREGDLSTMTYFLLAQLNAEGGSLELKQVFDVLERDVPRYIERAFPGTTQTPLMLSNLSAPLYLRLGPSE
ncbi:MAG TPA: caspase family protein [Pirellulaceae bacterium]|nr:caspase family protein [Pirellulaceae bacterium]